jgi:hypothetical protein
MTKPSRKSPLRSLNTNIINPLRIDTHAASLASKLLAALCATRPNRLHVIANCERSFNIKRLQ